MTGTFTFPTNVEKAYLDVFLESQSDDEFWYTCFPNDLAAKLDNCGNTAFREGEVTLDGQPAGVAPIYPWIYTGGIDPYLWIPIPGVETLNFAPYRIDLTPFAAQLDDGNKHTIAVSVFNDDDYFAANATLLVYEDHGSTQVTGALVRERHRALARGNRHRARAIQQSRRRAWNDQCIGDASGQPRGLRDYVEGADHDAGNAERFVLQRAKDRCDVESLLPEHHSDDDDFVEHVNRSGEARPIGAKPVELSVQPALQLRRRVG